MFTEEMKKYTVILNLVCLFAVQNIYAQHIQINCLQVNDSADVIIYFETITIPDTYQVEIYTSLDYTGPYVLLATITDSNVDTFLHENANAHLQQNFYYLKAVSSDGNPSLPIYFSDTLENIYVVLDNQGSGIAYLYWQPFSTFTSLDSFFVDRKTEDVWMLLSTLHTTSYEDTITFCGKTTYYRIRYDIGRACECITYAVSDFFTDVIAPEMPRLDTVSINQHTQKTEMGWEPSKSEDTYGYIVYIFKDGIWKTIDTLYGAENTFYIDNENSAINNSQSYRIAAIDTCLNASPLGDLHNTLLLSRTFEKCDSIVSLSWNTYQNMPEGIDSFRVYASSNQGAFHIIATVTGNKNAYDYKHVNTANDYRFFVQAVNKKLHFTASSNIVEVAFNRNIANGKVDMRYVTVIDNSYIEIAASVDDTVFFNDIYVYKSVDNAKSFTLLTKQKKSNAIETYVFEDKNVNVERLNYYYYFSLTDECDMEYVCSDTAANIVLTAIEEKIGYNSMNWTEYPWFISGLDGYNIYRKTSSDNEFSLLTFVSPVENTCDDYVWDLTDVGGVFYYKIAAIALKQSPFQDQSISNTIKITKEPFVFIPNAFAPEGINKIFKPVCLNINENTYEFKVYNRWGSLLFSTNDLNEGWDGTYNKQAAPQGIYTYVVSYALEEEERIVKRGTFLLLR